MSPRLPVTAALERAQSAPIRSCAACRARLPREALLRFVHPAGQIDPLGDGRAAVNSEGPAAPPARACVDLKRTRPGRGLNLGPSPVCIARADKRGVFQRQWKRHLSPEDLAVLVAETRRALVESLHSYLVSASARGGFIPVPGGELALVEPTEARILWERDELSEVVEQVAPGVAASPRIAAKIKAMTRAVSEFTFARVGGIKRRLEPPEACEALERCEGGELRGSAMPRQRRGGAGSLSATSDGRDG